MIDRHHRNPLGFTYDHYPVGIVEFLESPDYMDGADEVWSSIKDRLKRLFDQPPESLRLSSAQEFIFEAGIGSGKSYLISLLFAYVIYRLLCLRNPQDQYGLARGSKIAIINMAKNATQAKKVVFGELKARIQNSPWFQKYGLPDPEIQSELRFPKDIVVIPGNSSETFPLGFNMFACNLDEAAFFNTGKENDRHDVAEEIYYAMNRRISGRFAGFGLMGVTSSPRYEEDFIERKVAESLKENAKHIMVSVLETWNSRPDDVASIEKGDYFELPHPKKKTLCKIPNRYKYDFQINPEKAWRDYGSVPSLVLEPYFKQFNLVQACVDTTLQNGMLPHGILREDFKPKAGTSYFIHIDLALVSDACGFAMAHKEKDGMVVVDLIHRIVGSQKKEIDIREVREIVITLRARGFYIGKVTYDQFQSAESIQEFRKKNIPSEVLSVDRDLKAYETLKELAYGSKLKLPFHEKFLFETQRLELIEGTKVDHPIRGSKDVSDAVAGAVFNAVNGTSSREVKMSIVG